MGVPAADPISPELVLVDPELAERARASLPEEPWRSFIPPPRPREVAAPVAVVAAEEPAPERRRPVGALLAAAVIAVALAVLAFGLLPSPDARPTLAPAASAPSPPTPPATTAPAAPPPAAAPAPATPARPAVRKPSKPAPRATRPRPARPAAPKPKPKPKPKPSPAAPAPLPSPPRPKPKPARPPAPPQRFVPARLFVWVPARGPVVYQFVLWREGKLVYQGFSRKPRMKIPGTVRFAAGRYVWVVRAGRTRRAAREVRTTLVTSRFTIR